MRLELEKEIGSLENNSFAFSVSFSEPPIGIHDSIDASIPLQSR